MAATLIDDFSSAAPWVALTPLMAPSVELSASTDPEHRGYLSDARSLRVEASAAAEGHFLRRVSGPIDLTSFTELRLWIRCSRLCDGTQEHPFRLRLQLGSAVLAVGSPGNDWHRYLPALGPNAWHYVRLGLDDLPGAVRSGVTEVRLTCTHADSRWSALLDDLMACRTELVADVDGALLNLLDGQLVLAAPVPAIVHVTGVAEPPAPLLRVVHYDIAHAGRRATGYRPRTDFTDTGYRVRPEAIPYDLHYRIEAEAADAATRAQMLEFVIGTLRQQRDLLVAGLPLLLEGIPRPQQPVDDPLLAPAPHYRVAAYAELGTSDVVVGARETRLLADLQH
jgi:hypothetical protein